MNRIIKNPFTAKYPLLDIHGETTDTCLFVIKDFINDNLKLKESTVVIIHGKGSGKLKKRTQEILSIHPKVKNYYIDMYNEGSTIVELNVD